MPLASVSHSMILLHFLISLTILQKIRIY